MLQSLAARMAAVASAPFDILVVVIDVYQINAFALPGGRLFVLRGLLTFAAYGMVLTAFSLSRVSYVTPSREVGIVIGVLMGVYLLKEPFGGGRLLGSSFIVGGLVLIALSP